MYELNDIYLFITCLIVCSIGVHLLRLRIEEMENLYFLFRDTVRDERSLQDEIKHTKDLLASLRSKIEALGAVTPRVGGFLVLIVLIALVRCSRFQFF